MMDPHDKRCRDIVAAYRHGERMPHDARAAAWSRLQAAIRAEDEPAAPARRDRRRDLAWAAVLVAAAALVLLFAADGRRSTREDAAGTGSQAAHGAAATGPAESVALDRETRTSAPAPESPPPPADAGASERPPAPPRPRVQRPRGADVPKDMPALDAELALLLGAREALGGGAPAGALARLAEHERAFPDGHLREERMLLQAQAQCELGRRDAARATAAALVRAFPESPHARTAAELCADAGDRPTHE